MKVALVHDYLNEFGGAEQVLMTMSEMWPDAPIYTAFKVPGSSAGKAFADKKVITSWMQYIPFYSRLYSPLRFLIPWIWGSFNFSDYDVVITSASWYITKGVRAKFEICYCHTPPRWLYGYQTSVNFQKYWPVKMYAAVVGHFLRMYDFKQAQKVKVFVANSKNVAARIEKFYRRKATVVYPPVEVAKIQSGKGSQRGDYYLIVSRVVGGKGIELAVAAAEKYNFKLKIAGEMAGFKNYDFRTLTNVEYLGRVSETQKFDLMEKAKGFLVLSRDEDFGITPVESMGTGTPVVAFNSGGYKETVVDGKTGALFDEYSPTGLSQAIKRFEKIKWNRETIRKHAQKFSTDRFKKEMRELVNSYA